MFVDNFYSFSVGDTAPDFVGVAEVYVIDEQEVFYFGVQLRENRTEVALHLPEVFDHVVGLADDVLLTRIRTGESMLEPINVVAELSLHRGSHTVCIRSTSRF